MENIMKNNLHPTTLLPFFWEMFFPHAFERRHGARGLVEEEEDVEETGGGGGYIEDSTYFWALRW